jgi:hypothetical protein
MSVPDLRMIGHVAPAASLPQRGPRDDFFCVRFRVWYPSFDCAIRTQYRTYHGCVECDQGRFNLKRHRTAVLGLRRPCVARD